MLPDNKKKLYFEISIPCCGRHFLQDYNDPGVNILTGCLQSLKNAPLLRRSDEYDLNMLALRPLGGSVVILMPFCKTVTGKSPEGYEVSHKRKLGWVDSEDSSSHICRVKTALH